ncbi:MAG: putative Histidine kinase [Candidatus Thorarchaeota archaeon]|nr:MAG: putative Histidine kinase [Candidatus Thorarchaeota archaeon]
MTGPDKPDNIADSESTISERQIHSSTQSLVSLSHLSKEILSSMPFPIFLLDSEKRISFANSEALRIVEREIFDVIGIPCQSIWMEQETDCSSCFLDDLKESESRSCIIQKSDGTIWKMTSSIIDISESQSGYILIAQDVSREIVAESIQKETDERYKLLAESSFDGVVLHVDREIVEASDSFAELFGYTPDEVIGMKIFDFFTPGSGEVIKERIETEYGQSYETVGLRKDGSTVLLEGFGRTCRYEGRPARIAAVKNIEAEKEAEDALKSSEERFRAVFERAGIGMAITSLENHFMHTNRALQDMLGYTEMNLVNMPLSDVTHPEDFILDEILLREIQLGSNDMYQLEKRFVRSDSEIMWARVTASVVRGKDGDAEFAIQMIEDITDYKRSERELRTASERSRLFLDIMSHDIRNQMQIILGRVSLVNEMVDNHVFEAMLEEAMTSVELCEAIIRKTQSTESLSEIPLKPRDLVEALQKNYEVFSERYPDVVFYFDTKLKKATVMADKYLDHLIENLVENAVIHNPRENKVVWISLEKSAMGYLFAIEDNGVGIPESARVGLFDMKLRIGGVGLHQSKQIVEKYSGRIEPMERVRDHPSRGTRFEVWLPNTI